MRRVPDTQARAKPRQVPQSQISLTDMLRPRAPAAREKSHLTISKMAQMGRLLDRAGWPRPRRRRRR